MVQYAVASDSTLYLSCMSFVALQSMERGGGDIFTLPDDDDDAVCPDLTSRLAVDL